MEPTTVVTCPLLLEHCTDKGSPLPEHSVDGFNCTVTWNGIDSDPASAEGMGMQLAAVTQTAAMAFRETA